MFLIRIFHAWSTFEITTLLIDLSSTSINNTGLYADTYEMLSSSRKIKKLYEDPFKPGYYWKVNQWSSSLGKNKSTIYDSRKDRITQDIHKAIWFLPNTFKSACILYTG